MTQASGEIDPERARVAAAAAKEITSGMVLGLGTGRAAEAFLECLAAMMQDGLKIVGVPTSSRTAIRAKQLGIPLTDLDTHPVLDLTVDGADEIDPQLRLIKGGGGALLREKIVACASREMVVIADSAKRVKTLGKFPLPIEIVPFGVPSTLALLEKAFERAGVGGALVVRSGAGGPFVSDNGNHIVDVSLGRIPDPEKLAAEITPIPGVVEHGMFIGIAARAYIADADGLERLTL
jgi:ribose 5-phosphate isomerase A